MNIGWLVPKVDLNIASVRHRVIYPGLMLARRGHVNHIFERPDAAIAALAQLDVLVVAKRLDAGVVTLVAAAADVGAPVVLDLCDDILELDYRSGLRSLHRSVYRAIAEQLAAVTTTGPYLRARLDAYGFAAPPSIMIPDCAESEKVFRAAKAFVRELAAGHDQEQTDALHGGGPRVRPQTLLARALRAAGRPRHSLSVLRALWREHRYARTADAQDLRRAVVPAAGRHRSEPIVVWFGNHGGPHSDFGMLTLLAAASDLRAAHREHPFTLVIVSNNERKYKAFFRHLGVPTQYVEWSQEEAYRQLARASAFVAPSGSDPFSLSKSANRALMALASGVPVVAQPLPALEDLSDCIAMGDLAHGLVRYLGDRQRARADVVKARELIASKYSVEAVADQWEALFRRLAGTRTPKAALPLGDQRRILFLVDLVQDLDLLLPVIDEVRAQGAHAAVTVSERAARTSPRVVEALIERRIAPTMITGRDAERLDSRWLRGADSLVTASETSAGPQRIARALTELAKAAGRRTYTMQHGLENLGLTYRDAAYPDLSIASQTIFTWADPDRLPDWVDPSIVSRARAVGRVRSDAPPHQAPLPSVLDGRSVIGIFENLHWERYDDDYRKRFLSDMVAAAAARPEALFIVRPHPAGQWLAKNPEARRDWPANLVLAGPRDPEWEPWHACALAAHLTGVITTPSTVALDAAEAKRPVAVVGDDRLDLRVYEPLSVLIQPSDWLAFIDSCLDGSAGIDLAERFKARVCLSGDAAARIAATVLGGAPDAVPPTDARRAIIGRPEHAAADDALRMAERVSTDA